MYLKRKTKILSGKPQNSCDLQSTMGQAWEIPGQG